MVWFALGIEMRLQSLLAFGIVVAFGWCACNNAHPGSKDLADSAKAVLEANEPENWPAGCQTYRAAMLDSATASAPQYVEPLVVDSQMAPFQVVDWNGIRIPIPDDQLDKLALIPDSIAAVRSESSSVMFSSLDMTAHFQDHFGEIDEFSGYAASGRNLVGWIEEGLALTANDIKCMPESMVSDLVGIVHSLFATGTVLVREETRLIRLDGSNPALLLGEFMPRHESTRIQYIFQHPSSKGIELLHITYHLDHPVELVRLMSAFVSAIDSRDCQVNGAIGSVVEAILDHDDDRAASLAESIGLTVQLGL